MNVSLIVACARNAVMGVRGCLPWHLSEDLKSFKQITLGKTVVMGRKTWLSLPVKPLPQRQNIVLSRRLYFHAPGAKVVDSIDRLSELLGDEECIVIGGAEVYQSFLPSAKKIYLTLVADQSVGDVCFPELDMHEWEELSRRHHTQDEKNDF